MPEVFPGSRTFVSVPIRCRKPSGAFQTLVRIADLQALDEDDRQQAEMFSSRERRHARGLRFAKRRYEWFAGRVAAKAAAIIHAGYDTALLPPHTITLLADAHGRPDPDTSWPAGMDLPSISHSHEYGVAMVSAAACGIDLQRIEERIAALEERIVNRAEQGVVLPSFAKNRTTGLTLVWSVKEAVKKMLLADRAGLFEAILIEKISRRERFSWRATCRLADTDQIQEVDAVQLEQYILAWCGGEGNNA